MPYYTYPKPYTTRRNCFGIPDYYRGWRIEQNYLNVFEASGPDYDASYEGPEDGWQGNGQFLHDTTYPALEEAIDDYIYDHPEATTYPHFNIHLHGKH